jgi:SAM-dependent methyltransferase
MLVALLAIGIFLGLQASLSSTLLSITAVVAIASASLLGYMFHQYRGAPLLTQHSRFDYTNVWDALASDPATAAWSASGETDELSLRRHGAQVAERITTLAGIGAQDDVVEIGSGVGRIGAAIAPRCRRWTGCDVSANMIGFASERLRQQPNASFVQLSGRGLRELPDASADVIYCTNVLVHLDPVERWRYAADAFRVLRPSGRLYFDTVALNSPSGWAMMENNVRQRDAGIYAPYAPVPSTADEFLAYFERAGFSQIDVRIADSLLIAVGSKPS